MWRPATATDEDLIVSMCVALFTEDPGEPMSPQQIRGTLARFRDEPWRGRAVVVEVAGQVVGYALLVSFWSNEYGGEIVTVDELYVAAPHRGRGLGSGLFEALSRDRALWPAGAVAQELEVTPGNSRARALYERMGFRVKNALLRRRWPRQ